MRIAWKVRVAGSFFMPGWWPSALRTIVGELAGPLDRPGGDDRPGDAARLRLLAIMEEDVGDLGFVGAVDEVGGARPVLAHPHVERPVGLEGEAALGLVELHRGDADIERDAVDRVDVAVGKRLTHPGETLRHKRQALPARGQRLAIPDRFGIAIESEDAGRPFVEDGLGVSARAERAVDMGLAGGDGERLDDIVDEDGDVRGRGGRRS